MTQATAPGADGPGAQARPPARFGARRTRLLVAVLAALVVAAGATAGVLGVKAEAADDRQRERAAAAAVAEQFALRMDNVDGTDFDGYIGKVNELLTTKAKTKNNEVFEVMKESYAAAKVKGTGDVLITAVGDLDEDSASVLVVHDASVTTTQGDIENHYRWTVSLVKVKGRWLVDDFNPVN